jgi:hypothetical protein
VQWNSSAAAASSSSSATAAPGSHERERAAWALRARGARAARCARALSGLAAASRAEDRYGVLLLSAPNLGDVLLGLGGAVLALQAYGRALSSSSPSVGGLLGRALGAAASAVSCPRHACLAPPELAAYALEDAMRRAAAGVVLAFGPSLGAALREAKGPPPYGSVAEVTALLGAMAAGQE